MKHFVALMLTHNLYEDIEGISWFNYKISIEIIASSAKSNYIEPLKTKDAQ